MIPTVIIINDGNKRLQDLEILLEGLVRTFHRSSIEGERLYGVFEGIIFFDEDGQKQLTRRDDYRDVITQVMTRVRNSKSHNKSLLKEYLQAKGRPKITMQTWEDFEVTWTFCIRDVNVEITNTLKSELDSYLEEMYD